VPEDEGEFSVKSEDLVSVVIPTYNHAAFLAVALDSLLSQTYENWEAIVVNNYSSDKTIEVVEGFQDSRIRLLNYHNNGVIGAARNRGIEIAKGDYVAFLDSDDSWSETKLSTCMAEFSADVDLVAHGLNYVGETTHKAVFCGPLERARYSRLLYNGNCIIPSATIVKRICLLDVGCFTEEKTMITAEDYHLWLKLAKSGIQMRFINEVLGFYRLHADNQSNTGERHLQAVFNVLEYFFPDKAQRSLLDKFRIRRCRGIWYRGTARRQQTAQLYTGALKKYGSALKCYPFDAKALVGAMMTVCQVIGRFSVNLLLGKRFE